MRSTWIIASVFVWLIAFWLGLADAQSCSSGGCQQPGLGITKEGPFDLAPCGTFSSCMQYICTDHMTITDPDGVVRCSLCYQDPLTNQLVTPQSVLACVAPFSSPPACPCQHLRNPQNACPN
jgi:hypothetical protein